MINIILSKKALEGVYVQGSLRYAKANNKYLEDYIPPSESTFLGYWDANNLYGWAMSQSLPYGSFKWLTDSEIWNLDITCANDDSPTGHFLEVDVEYPETLHDSHNDLPLLAEQMVPPNSKFNIPKLIPNLRNKTKYIVHYRNLKQAIGLGLVVTKIHRVLSFSQAPWLKTYIDYNTRLRQAKNNEFEKDYFKLKNNSVFGKTMENVDKRINVHLISH